MSKNIQLLNDSSAQDLRSFFLKDTINASLSIADISRDYLLSNLLPYDPHTKKGDRLTAGLKEYDFLLMAAEHAMESLEKDNISFFDPLVGENACQIRALKNCLIFSKYPVSSDKLLMTIRLSRKKIEDFLGSISIFIKSNFSLSQILEKRDIDIKLTYSEIYLIKSYLLTIVKTIKSPKEETPFVKNEYTDIKKLKSIKPISTMFAESLIKKLRESLSAFSVSFVQELYLKTVPESLNNTISEKFYIRHNRLHCLPCYWATKILMAQSLQEQIPLIIIARQLAKDQEYNTIREIALFFKPTLFGYQYACLDSFNSNNTALVLLVNSCRETHEFPELLDWKEELLKYNPIDLILAYAASHRQYPDITKNDLVDQLGDEQYKFYKEKASEWGCSIENPYLFFLSHAFCEKIGNIQNHIFLPDTKQNVFLTDSDRAKQFADLNLAALYSKSCTTAFH